MRRTQSEPAGWDRPKHRRCPDKHGSTRHGHTGCVSTDVCQRHTARHNVKVTVVRLKQPPVDEPRSWSHRGIALSSHISARSILDRKRNLFWTTTAGFASGFTASSCQNKGSISNRKNVLNPYRSDSFVLFGCNIKFLLENIYQVLLVGSFLTTTEWFSLEPKSAIVKYLTSSDLLVLYRRWFYTSQW